jgi:V8-like Glu-specific endopeptidase
MATTNDVGPRPPVKINYVEKDEVRKYIESSGKTTSVTEDGTAATKHLGDLQAPSTIKADFDQGPITDTTKFPHSAIGVVHVQYGTTRLYQTAVLISPNAILTTGELIPDSDWIASDWSMQFVPGFNQGAAPFGEINVTQGYGYPPGARGDSVDDDYMVFHLASPVGSTTGWFNIFSSTDPAQYTFLSFNLFSAGYPSESSQIQATGYSIKKASPYNGGSGAG